jgi:hypothetical protein
MHFMQMLVFAGIFSLYISFSAVQGYLLRSMRGPSYRRVGWWIIGAYSIFIWLPTSAFIFALNWLPAILRALVILAGLASTGLVIIKPDWMPGTVWTRPFNRTYLGVTMALVALSVLIPWLLNPNVGALTLGLSACLAGVSALRDMTAQV